MAVQIIFDSDNNVQAPTMVLSYRNGNSIGAIIPHDIHFSAPLNSYKELTFDVYKRLNGIECSCWNQLTDFKLVYCVEWDLFFEIYVEIDESDETVKHIQCKTLCEAELSQTRIYGLEVNTELDISRDDYKATIIYSSDENISLIHKLLEKTPNFSIGHIDKSIAKLQRTFKFEDISIYDAFQEVSDEVDCLFIFEAKKSDDGKIDRIINIYDLHSHCEECGHRDIDEDVCPEYIENKSGHPNGGTKISSGYGEDTTIFVSNQNLADDITYSSDTDSVKNCFKLVAGDDLMTATIKSCAPTKSGYLWHFTEETKGSMSDDLKEILNRYQQLYTEYNTEFQNDSNGIPPYGLLWGKESNDIRSNYNAACIRYGKKELVAPVEFKNFSDIMNLYYNAIDFELYLKSGMMPSTSLDATTAKDEIAKVTVSSISPIAIQDVENASLRSVDNAVSGIIKAIVDSRYKISISDSRLLSKTWSGTIILERYSDEDDVSKKTLIGISLTEDLETFTKQKIQKALAKKKDEATDVVSIFDKEETEFKSEIRKYSLSQLNSFRDAGQACLNLMIEMGITNLSTNDDNSTTVGSTKDIYESIYLPYYEKVHLLDDEIELRQSDIQSIIGVYDTNGNLKRDGMLTCLDKIIACLQENLELEGFIKKISGSKADSLLMELVSFRREDTYQNDNFVSDGLDNAQLFSRALEFVSEAEKDIILAATPIHTISSTLKNLLAMQEFKPLKDKFELGNWIRVEIDNSIYKLRLIKYEISYDEFSTISVEFSDVQLVNDNISDIKSILNQASSIASNYNNIKILANQSKKSGDYVWEWVNEGLALTKVRIVDEAENQNISWDEHGFLCREYSPIMDSYEDEQIKIINKGLYVTDDNWKTSKAGIGNFVYYNPDDGEYHNGYGVVADTLVGNLILSKEVGIYNEGGSVQIDNDGLVITTKKTAGEIVKIRKEVEVSDENGDNVVSYENLMYTDTYGDLHIKGNITATSLSLGDGVDLSKYVDLSDYATIDSLSDYLKTSGYETDKKNIENTLSSLENSDQSQIEAIGTINENVIFFATEYADSNNGTLFTVSKNGLLTAKNAVVFGTIYATNGEFIGSIKSGGKYYTKNGTGYYNYNFNAANGKIELGLNSDGTYNMTVNNDGTIIFGDNVSLSWSNISGAPTTSEGLSEDEVTQITKNTITTNYVNGLKVTAKEVSSDWVYAGNISANQITTGLLKSGNYNASDLNGTVGSAINLTDGTFNFGGGSLKYRTDNADGGLYEFSLGDNVKIYSDETILTLKGDISFAKIGVNSSWYLCDGVWEAKAKGSSSKYCRIISDNNTKYNGVFISSSGDYSSDQIAIYHNGDMVTKGSLDITGDIVIPYSLKQTDGKYGIIRVGNESSPYFKVDQNNQKTIIGNLTISNKTDNNNKHSDFYVGEDVILSIQPAGVAVATITASDSINCVGGATFLGGTTVSGTTTINGNIKINEITGSDKSKFEINRDIYLYSTQGLYNYDSGCNMIRVTSNGKLFMGDDNREVTTHIYGSSIYMNDTAYATSDQRLKTDIQCFSELHETLFKSLRPVSFKYIEGTSDRTHFGFIAQEVRDAILNAELTTQDVAAFVEMQSDRDDMDTECALRYDEFISLNTHMIQKCLNEIKILKDENALLKNRICILEQNK